MPARIERAVARGEGTVVRMSEVAPFRWSRLHVIPPYASDEFVRAELGPRRFRPAPDPGHVLLVFSGRRVRTVVHPRWWGDMADLYVPGGYTPRDAVFVVHKAGRFSYLASERRLTDTVLSPDPKDAIHLRTDAAVYTRGSDVRVDLVNDSGRQLLFSLCHGFLRLERRESARWHEVRVSLGPFACVLRGYSSLPGSTTDGRIGGGRALLPADLAPGAYRILTSVGFYSDIRPVGQDFTLSTPPFLVVE